MNSHVKGKTPSASLRSSAQCANITDQNPAHTSSVTVSAT